MKEQENAASLQKPACTLRGKKNVIFTSSVNNTWKKDQKISEATIQFIWYHSFIAAEVMAINTTACSKLSRKLRAARG